MTRVRAFIAINFPTPVIRRLAEEVRVLQAPVAAAGYKVAWVPATNMHLTLKFLGSIPVDSVEAIRGRLRTELASQGSFELEVRGLGAFPSPAHARVLWAGIKPNAVLAAMQQNVEAWMESLGLPREERPFHPHLTLGRVKEHLGTGSLEAALGERSATLYGAGRIHEVVLYESRTRRDGAEYVELARVPLGVREGGPTT